MKHILYILFVIFILGCKPTNEVYVSNFSSLPLEFSSDTILFDTLISSEKVSITKRLLVYNKSTNAVNINSIALGNLYSSPFNIVVNGEKKSSFSNVELLGSDSMLVLINVVVAPSNIDSLFILSDSINFTVSNLHSRVLLNTWGQDAYYHVNDTNKVNTSFLSNKPHVVYGNLFVDSTAKLSINPGTKLLFYNNASLIVKGDLTVTGSSSNKVVFQALRQDEDYKFLPGQWEGIKVSSKGTLDFIWTRILNAKTGIAFSNICSSNIRNTFIGYVTETCIKSSNANLNIANSVFYASLKNLISISGGQVSLQNNTLDNYATGLGSSFSSLSIIDTDNPLKLLLQNNIVFGNLSNELILRLNNPVSTVTDISKNIFKLPSLNNYTDNIFITDSRKFRFNNPSIGKFAPDTVSLKPLVLSPAIDNGQTIINVTDVEDFEGKFRDSKPDIGAVEFVK